jgi:hypothetical protein
MIVGCAGLLRSTGGTVHSRTGGASVTNTLVSAEKVTWVASGALVGFCSLCLASACFTCRSRSNSARVGHARSSTDFVSRVASFAVVVYRP